MASASLLARWFRDECDFCELLALAELSFLGVSLLPEAESPRIDLASLLWAAETAAAAATEATADESDATIELGDDEPAEELDKDLLGPVRPSAGAPDEVSEADSALSSIEPRMAEDSDAG